VSDAPAVRATDVDYTAVPWYRKSSFVSPMTVVGLFFGPAILVVCAIVLSGDVFYKTRDEAGRLQKWGEGNKIAAVVILAMQLWFTLYLFGYFRP
jgi:hypothetical protein